jgi:TIR domain
MMPERDHVFISYAGEDGLFVDWLCHKLVSEGYRVWCDRLKLLGGESYPTDIDRAIKDQTFSPLADLSKSTFQKPNPVKDRALALNLGRERGEDFLISLNLDGLTPTELDWMQSD